MHIHGVTLVTGRMVLEEASDVSEDPTVCVFMLWLLTDDVVLEESFDVSV
jgi:hypothetical protein